MTELAGAFAVGMCTASQHGVLPGRSSGGDRRVSLMKRVQGAASGMNGWGQASRMSINRAGSTHKAWLAKCIEDACTRGVSEF
jgi:hypothetical protein